MCAHSICSKNNRTFMKVMTKLLLNVFLLVFINIVSEALSIRIQYTYPQCVDDCKKNHVQRSKYPYLLKERAFDTRTFNLITCFDCAKFGCFPNSGCSEEKKTHQRLRVNAAATAWFIVYYVIIKCAMEHAFILKM